MIVQFCKLITSDFLRFCTTTIIILFTGAAATGRIIADLSQQFTNQTKTWQEDFPNEIPTCVKRTQWENALVINITLHFPTIFFIFFFVNLCV